MREYKGACTERGLLKPCLANPMQAESLSLTSKWVNLSLIRVVQRRLVLRLSDLLILLHEP
jgi:hypothetical protein